MIKIQNGNSSPKVSIFEIAQITLLVNLVLGDGDLSIWIGVFGSPVGVLYTLDGIFGNFYHVFSI